MWWFVTLETNDVVLDTECPYWNFALLNKINIILFFVLVTELPVLKADAIKYVMVFRQQVSHGTLQAMFVISSLPAYMHKMLKSGKT